MQKDFTPDRLDIAAFAAQEAALSGADEGPVVLQTYARLAPDDTDAPEAASGTGMYVRWQVQGEARPVRGGVPQPWLHLKADCQVLQTCQRCLRPVTVPVALDRSYRFVADEATATREDPDTEEDLLVLDRQFNLYSLIEDELLMELPLVARHGVCPVALPRSAQSPDFSEGDVTGGEGGKPHPFAALATLKLPPAK